MLRLRGPHTCLNGRGRDVGIGDQEANCINAIPAHSHTSGTHRQHDRVNLKYFWVLPVRFNVRNSTLHFYMCYTLESSLNCLPL